MTTKCVTALVIGESGTGKSQNGWGFLQKNDVFETNSSPDSCTYRTSAQSNTVNGITRYYIDTQGLSDPEQKDAEYIQQMVEFLKNWKLGINSFLIMLNIQSPRFDAGIKQMIMIINDFFNNPDFWNQAGLVFTRCFPGYFNRKMGETQYRQKVIDFIKSLPNCESLNPQMPCFFVDSVNWETDQDTIKEYTRMFEFAHKNNPVPTQNLQVVRPEYKSKEEEILEKQLVSSYKEGEGENAVKYFNYEDQKRYKITEWNGNIHYSGLETIRSWTEEQYSTVEVEHMTKDDKLSEEKFKFENYGSRRYLGLFGPKKSRPVHDFYLETVKHKHYKRKRIVDPDGIVTYTDWEEDGEDVEQKKV